MALSPHPLPWGEHVRGESVVGKLCSQKKSTPPLTLENDHVAGRVMCVCALVGKMFHKKNKHTRHTAVVRVLLLHCVLCVFALEI